MAQVLRITNAGRRTAIQNFTRAQCFPDYVTFVQDSNGDWVTSVEVISDLRYNHPDNKSQVVDVLTDFGEVVTWVGN